MLEINSYRLAGTLNWHAWITIAIFSDNLSFYFLALNLKVQYLKSVNLLSITPFCSLSLSCSVSTSILFRSMPSFTDSAAAVPATSPVRAHTPIALVTSHPSSDPEMHLPAVIRFFVLTAARDLYGLF